jgi:hypothetical protein
MEETALRLVEAEEERAKLEQQRAKLKDELAESQTALGNTDAELQETKRGLRSASSALKLTEAQLKAREDEKEQFLAKLAAVVKEMAQTQSRLLAAERELREAEKGLVASMEERATAEADLAALRLDLAQRQQTAMDLQARLDAADKNRKDVEKIDEQMRGVRGELSLAEKRVEEMMAELALVRKKAEEAGLKLTDAQKQGQTVQVEAATLRKLLEEQRATAGRLQQQLSQVENRFAGVDLTGRQVIFLVDTSGSMGSRDTQTLDPKKWPEVVRTLVQLLKSLPDVQKFQVILFADEPQFILGKPGQWLDFDRAKSPDEVSRALARVAPKGNTNMYAAFEAAFRLRAQGLDTIFVLSDGLPNVGPGLPAQPPREEAAQLALLSRHVRDTLRNRWNQKEPKVRIHAVGFFYDSPNLGAFLWALARENGGSFVGMSKP